jgi:hypothetical protein
VDKFLAMTWQSSHRARIKVTTSSDWTTLAVLDGGAWIQSEQVSASPSATMAGIEAGDRFVLKQSLEDATAGKEVEMTWDVLLTDLDSGQDLVLQIERGHFGKTEVVIYNYAGSEPLEVKTFEWDQITSGRNSYDITIPANLLIDPNL